MSVLLLAAYFLSGLAALLLQQVWNRQLATLLGASSLGTAAVLAAFMGGLGLGAAIGGRLAGRLAWPLRAYGGAELLLAALALLVAPGLELAQAALPAAVGLLGRSPLVVLSLRLVTAFVLVGGPALLLGLGFPLIAQALTARVQRPARWLAWLYAANVAGAMTGALAAGFLLIPLWGLAATTRCAALLAALAGLLALGVSRARGVPPVSRAALLRSPRIPAVVQALAFLSGLAVLALETFWARLFATALGASVQVFAWLVALVLAGLALGATATGVRGSSPRGIVGPMAWALGAALLLTVEVWLAGSLPVPGLGAGMALWVLPPAFALGGIFPSTLRTVAASGSAGPAAARLYLWNTLGSVAGALGAGLWLLPAWGDPATLLAVRPGEQRVVFRFGRSASVEVVRDQAANMMKLRSDGQGQGGVRLHDGPSRVDQATQSQLAHLPLLLRPRSERVLVIGYGSGSTAGAALRHPLRELDIVEIEEEVLRASPHFEPANGRPLADPRTRAQVEDARGFLLLERRPYDVIISQPSEPWTAGSSQVFTREFWQLAARRLAPDGIFCQWIQLYGIDPPRLRVLLATFQAAFPRVQVFKPRWTVELLLIGSSKKLDWDRGALEAAATPAILAELRGAGIVGSAALLGQYLLDEEGLARWTTGASLNTDDRPSIEFETQSLRLADPLAHLANVRALSACMSETGAAQRLGPDQLDGAFLAELALAYLRGGFAIQARALAREALRREDSALAWQVLGDALHLALEEAEARRAWKRAAELEPQLAWGRRRVIHGYIGAGRYDLADRELAVALEVEPEAPELLELQGRLRYTQGRLSEALELFRHALTVHPGDADLWLAEARCRARLGSNPQMLECLQRVVERLPEHAGARYDLGVALVQAGRRDEAQAAYRRAIELAPAYARAKVNLAVLLLERGQGADAQRLLEQAAADDPENADALNNLGALSLAEGRLDVARDLWQRALALQELPDYHNNLAIVLERMGAGDEAQRHLQRSLELAPDQPQAAAIRARLRGR